MSDRRLLILGVVTDLHDVSITYPSCQQCYSKLLVDSATQRFHCIRCNTSCVRSAVQWRYRLVVSVSDGSTLGKLVVFGRTLDGFFGKSATDFRRSLNDLERTGYPAESLLMDALMKTFHGKYFYFGFKVTGSMMTSSPATLSEVLKSEDSKSMSQFDHSTNFENYHALAYQMLASNSGVYATVTDHMRVGVKTLRTAHLRNENVNEPFTENAFKAPNLSRNLSIGQNSSTFSRTASFISKQESVLFSFENSSDTDVFQDNSKLAYQVNLSEIESTNSNTNTNISVPKGDKDLRSCDEGAVLKEWEISFSFTESNNEKIEKHAYESYDEENKLISSNDFLTPCNQFLSRSNSTFNHLPITQTLNFSDINDNNALNTCCKIDKELQKREVTFSQRYLMCENSKNMLVIPPGEVKNNTTALKENIKRCCGENKSMKENSMNQLWLHDSFDDDFLLQSLSDVNNTIPQQLVSTKQNIVNVKESNSNNEQNMQNLFDIGNENSSILDTTDLSERTDYSGKDFNNFDIYVEKKHENKSKGKNVHKVESTYSDIDVEEFQNTSESSDTGTSNALLLVRETHFTPFETEEHGVLKNVYNNHVQYNTFGYDAEDGSIETMQHSKTDFISTEFNTELVKSRHEKFNDNDQTNFAKDILEVMDLPESEGLEVFLDSFNYYEIDNSDNKSKSSENNDITFHDLELKGKDKSPHLGQNADFEHENDIKVSFETVCETAKENGHTLEFPNSEDLEDFLENISGDIKYIDIQDNGCNDKCQTNLSQQHTRKVGDRNKNFTNGLQDSLDLEDFLAELSITQAPDVKEDLAGIKDRREGSREKSKTDSNSESLKDSGIAIISVIKEKTLDEETSMKLITDASLKACSTENSESYKDFVSQITPKVMKKIPCQNSFLANNKKKENDLYYCKSPKPQVDTDCNDQELFSESNFDSPEEDLSKAFLSGDSDIFGDSFENSNPRPVQNKVFMCMFSKKCTIKNAKTSPLNQGIENNKCVHAEALDVEIANSKAEVACMDTESDGINMSEDLFDLSNTFNYTSDVICCVNTVRTPVLNEHLSQFDTSDSACEFDQTGRLFDTSTPGLDQCILESQEFTEKAVSVSDKTNFIYSDNNDRRVKSRHVQFDHRLRRVSSCHLMDIKMRLNNASPSVISEKMTMTKPCLKSKFNSGINFKGRGTSRILEKQFLDIDNEQTTYGSVERKNDRKETQLECFESVSEKDNSKLLVDSFGSQDLFSPSPVLEEKFKTSVFKLYIKKPEINNFRTTTVAVGEREQYESIKTKLLKSVDKDNDIETKTIRDNHHKSPVIPEAANIHSPDLWGDESDSFLICAEIGDLSKVKSPSSKVDVKHYANSKKITRKENIVPSRIQKQNDQRCNNRKISGINNIIQTESKITSEKIETTPDIFSKKCNDFSIKSLTVSKSVDKQTRGDNSTNQIEEPVQTWRRKSGLSSKGLVSFHKRLVLKCLVNTTSDCDSDFSLKQLVTDSPAFSAEKVSPKTSLVDGDEDKPNFVEDSPDLFCDSPQVGLEHFVCDNSKLKNVPLSTNILCKKLFF